MSVAERVTAIRQELRQYTDRPVTLVGVVKKQPTDRIVEAIAAGLGDIANNYEQEGADLRAQLAGKNVRWHFVGNIQSRKAKLLVDYDMVQSLERIVVAEVWQRTLDAEGTLLNALVEVNIAGESQKGGVDPAELPVLLRDLRRFSAVRVRGLMAMPPPLEPVEERRPFFKKMRELFEASKKDAHFDVLSMGTSADYRIAVEEGATMIRLGESLFGPR